MGDPDPRTQDQSEALFSQPTAEVDIFEIEEKILVEKTGRFECLSSGQEAGPAQPADCPGPPGMTKPDLVVRVEDEFLTHLGEKAHLLPKRDLEAPIGMNKGRADRAHFRACFEPCQKLRRSVRRDDGISVQEQDELAAAVTESKVIGPGIAGILIVLDKPDPGE
jgi:hypothetical protein